MGAGREKGSAVLIENKNAPVHPVCSCVVITGANGGTEDSHGSNHGDHSDYNKFAADGRDHVVSSSRSPWPRRTVI